jgi:RimJ/RimL family protein N-acetyltransferase
MNPRIETERLVLRPLTESDFAFLRALHLDREVMKYIAGGAERTEAQTRVSLEAGLRLALENPERGVWIAEEKATGTAVGNFLLRPPATGEKIEGTEIGYSLPRAHWGKGYATEAVRALAEYAFRALRAPRLVALVHPENDLSRKVLAKIGFQAIDHVFYVDPLTGARLPSELWELSKPN